LCLKRFGDGCGVFLRPQLDAVLALIHAARLDEAGVRQRRHVDDGDWPKREAFAQTVGLFRNDAGYLERCFAKPDGAAGCDIKPFGQGWSDVDFTLCGSFGRATFA